jgi:two-component system response regulator AtoC
VSPEDASFAEGLDGTVREEGNPPGERVLHVVWQGGGRTLALRDGQRVVLGRDVECDVVIPSPAVSRRHAAVLGGAVSTIEDLGSVNGTTVGARVLAAGGRAAMGGGIVARIGPAIVVIDETVASGRASSSWGDWVVGPHLERVLTLAARYAVGMLGVLVTGETGVGKERIAAFIHERSPRAGKPLLRINCAAFPEPLLESEFFGHERGAFTGAVSAKRGLLEAADGGTVFLDEIAEMPLLLQAKMLRAVEAQEVFRVGALQPIRIDVRFVAATNRDLVALSREGGFRSDLFYRLGGAVLHVPPLRERREEIIPLAEAFLQRARRVHATAATGLAPDATAALLAHNWPGNVRELRNVIDRAVLLCDGAWIEPAHLPFGDLPVPPLVREGASPAERVEPAAANAGSAGSPSLRASVDAEELRQIREALAQAGGNQSRAAAALGVSRQTLLRRLDKHGINRPRK